MGFAESKLPAKTTIIGNKLHFQTNLYNTALTVGNKSIRMQYIAIYLLITFVDGRQNNISVSKGRTETFSNHIFSWT